MNTVARSRINDADIAAESTELSKAQVLNQAASSYACTSEQSPAINSTAVELG